MQAEPIVVVVERAIASEWERWSRHEGIEENLGDIPRAFLAVAAVTAYERAAAEARRLDEVESNIAYLHANIAQMDKFIKQADPDDPVGQMQWTSRKQEFQRQLDEALATHRS